jgi:hypothetical protein
VGFCAVEIPPSPKAQFHEVIDPEVEDDPSVKDVELPSQTEVAEKLETGRAFITALTLMEPLHPRLSVTVTPKLPAV